MNTPASGSLLYDTPLAEADGGVGAFVRSWLPALPARVLEVGCGDGKLALALAEEGWKVSAVDPAAPEGEPFIRGAIEELEPSEHEPFDAAVAVLSLHHLHDIGVALDKIHSLLNSSRSARFLILFPAHPFGLPDLKEV